MERHASALVPESAGDLYRQESIPITLRLIFSYVARMLQLFSSLNTGMIFQTILYTVTESQIYLYTKRSHAI